MERYDPPHNQRNVFIRLGKALEVTNKLLDVVHTFGLSTSLCSGARIKFMNETVNGLWWPDAMAERARRERDNRHALFQATIDKLRGVAILGLFNVFHPEIDEEDPGLAESSTRSSPACRHPCRPRNGKKRRQLVNLEGREKTGHRLHRMIRVSVIDRDRSWNSRKTSRVEGDHRLGLCSVFGWAENELDHAIGTGRRTGAG